MKNADEIKKSLEHLSVIRFVQKQLSTQQGCILIGSRQDFVTVLTAVLRDSNQKVAILVKTAARKAIWAEIPSLNVVTETKDSYDVVFCDEPRGCVGVQVPRNTIFLCDLDASDLYGNLKVLHWMVKSLGTELKYKELNRFEQEFGSRKVRLKIFCNRFTYRIPKKAIPLLLTTSESSSSDTPFARSDVDTQIEVSSKGGKIFFAEHDTQEMSPLCCEDVNVYEADTIPWIPPLSLKPTKSVEQGGSSTESEVENEPFIVQAEIHQPPSTSFTLSDLTLTQIRPHRADCDDLLGDSFEEEDWGYPHAQDPNEPFDIDEELDPDRYRSFIGNPNEDIQPEYFPEDTPPEIQEVKPTPEPVISISSGSSGKRPSSPDLFGDEDDDVIFVPNPAPPRSTLAEPAPKITRTKSPETRTPPNFFSPYNNHLFCPSFRNPWSSEKKMEMFEITKNDIFSHVIRTNPDGDMSPAETPVRKRLPSPPLMAFNPIMSDDEQVESSQPWFSFRTPKKRTTPCKTRGSSKRQPPADGWLNKFVEVSPKLPSPRTPASRKRLFKVKPPVINSPEDLFA